MEKLSKEDLIKALALAAKPVKPRKKAERNAEQQKELTERLAKMRETSLANRVKKAEAKKATQEVSSPAKSKIETALHLAKGDLDHKEDIFEKKYSSAFEKMTDSLGRLESHFSDIKQMKISKAEQRKQEAEAKAKPAEKPKPIELEIKEETPYKPQAPYQAPYQAPIQPPTQPFIQEAPKAFRFNDFNRMSFGKKK
jgi:hypothetical protein